MMYRMFSSATVAVTMFVAAAALAAPAANDSNQATHDGKVVSVSNDKLVMKGQDGQEHSHTLAPNARVTCDGNACKASDLKAGTQIRVTTTRDDPRVAIEVESLGKNPLFANTQEGKFLRIAGNRFVMSNKQGQEQSQELADDANLTCDGKVCKANDLKAGMSIRVTTRKNDKNVVVRVDAIDKDADFARG